MATTIDHLSVDHRITVLRDFVDAKGTLIRTGDTGVLTQLKWDDIRREIHLEITRPAGKIRLVFSLLAKTGPRNGHMRDYFELGEDVTPPRIIPAFHDPSKRQMIVPPPEGRKAEPRNNASWERAAEDANGPDKLVEVEEAMQRACEHIGAAASIAEMYARRMRMFQRAGNEPRAIAAFKLAVGWMGTYASWATSGGEGAALSYERDQFQRSLALEFGYDPTDDGRAPESCCHLP